MSWVLDHSTATGSDRLVLLAIANHCDKQGRDAYPGLQLIADEARVSKRTAIRSIQNLEEIGELHIERGGGAHNTNRYVIAMGPPDEGCQVVTVPDPALPTGTVTSATKNGDICDRKGDTGVTRTFQNRPEPSLTCDVEPTPSPSARCDAVEGEGSKIITTATELLPADVARWVHTAKDEGGRRTLETILDRLADDGHDPEDLAIALAEPMPDDTRSPVAVMLHRARSIAAGQQHLTARPAGLTAGEAAAATARAHADRLAGLIPRLDPDEILTEIARLAYGPAFGAALEHLARHDRTDLADYARTQLDELTGLEAAARA